MVVKPKRNNAQHQPLTTVLRNIVREYPAGGGVLRELCQNADDSGATAIEFILDPNYHPTEPLLHPEGGLAEFQGPALLAYNNRTFSETDFRSLSKIGDSEKIHDLNSTGKFGRGFNSVYNWTDNPSILSGSSLLILDPHEAWSRHPDINEPGGPLWDFVQDHQETDMINQLSPFNCLVDDFSRPFEGTIIRMPLRTAEQASRSKIVGDLERKCTDIDDIKAVFESFSTEMAEYLLFLRHISSITLKIGDEVFAEARARKFSTDGDITDTFSIDEAYQTVLVRGEEKARDHQFVMEITFRKNGATSTTSRYAVTHHMQHGHPDQKLEQWSRKYKLFPWAAIASPISETSCQKFAGKLFSTLPLPIHSQHPAHIHAMFSITPDRHSIHRDEDSTVSEETETKRGARWNRWIFEELVVHAWTANLQFVSDLALRKECAESFSGWSVWPLGGKEQATLGVGLLEAVFERIVARGLKLLPTIGGSLAHRSEVIFASQLDESLEVALREAGVVVMYPPSDRREQLCRVSRLRDISPKEIRLALTALQLAVKPVDSDGLEAISDSSRSILLDYVLSDGQYEHIGECEARLLPMLDGTFRPFSPVHPRIRFAQSEEQLKLFERCQAFMIDNSKLSSAALHQFTTRLHLLEQYTCLSPWDMPGARWYCCNWIFDGKTSRDHEQFMPEVGEVVIAEWVDRFWTWAISHNRTEAKSAFEHLWLLPLAGNRYRALPPEIPILDVSGNGQVATLFREILVSSPTAVSKYPLYTVDKRISRTNTEFFREAEFIRHSEKIENIVTWLDSFPDFLDVASFAQRTLLVRILGELAVKRISKDTKARVRQLLSRLPLFHRVFDGASPSHWLSLSGGADYVAVSTQDGLPSLIHTDTVFVDKDNDGVDAILSSFSLAKIPSHKELLEQYVIPNLERWVSVVPSLATYILQPRNLRELDDEAMKRLSSIKFVPVRDPLPSSEVRRKSQVSTSVLKSPPELVDPSTIMAALYFADENVFVREDFLSKFRSGLKRLGMITSVTDQVVFDRLDTYSRNPDRLSQISSCLKHLLDEVPKPPPLGSCYLELKWIPASMEGTDCEALFSPLECRDHSRPELVKYSMPLTKLDFGSHWAKMLGWDGPPEPRYVIEQIEKAVSKRDNTVIVSLLDSGWLLNETVQKTLEGKSWIPGAAGGYYKRSDIFLRYASFEPHLDVLRPEVARHFSCDGNLPAFLTVKEEPSFQKLEEVQANLASVERLSEQNLRVFVRLLEAVASRFPNEDFKAWKVPDGDGVLHAFSEMTAGNHEEHSQDAITKSLHFLHPDISQSTIKRLRFPTVQERFLDKRVGPEFIQDFEQGQELTTMISDVLQRYPIEDTFNEYLANAEDSGGAHKIRWVLDNTSKHPKDNLISRELAECTEGALVCYNDGVFTQKDLQSLINIGNASKRDEPSKIGRFGRGSLTMYHWTCTPSFVSGEHFVIFDPEQTRLPHNTSTRKRRKGMLLKLKDVRQLWPDQLRPFEGLFGFDSDTVKYDGTLFRFPIMESRARSKMYSSVPEGITVDRVRHALTIYGQDAHMALLFLKNIQSIECYERNSSGKLDPLWNVSVKLCGTETHVPDEKLDLIIVSGGTSGLRTSWFRLTSTLADYRIPGHLRATRGRHKLQARCGIAAMVRKQNSGMQGRLFLDVPTANGLDLPVHITADLVIQSDRRHFIELEGSDWNNWMMEDQLAGLYISLLENIASSSLTSVYDYWPKPPTTGKKIGDVVKRAIWKRILDGTNCIFPVQSIVAKPASSETATEHVSYRTALLNLLPNDHILNSILPRLNLNTWRLVKPVGEAHKAFSAFLTAGDIPINAVSPSFVANIFKSEDNCRILQEIWSKELSYKIEGINQILGYIFSKGQPQDFIDCIIIPLMNTKLGRVRATGDSNYFLLDRNRLLDMELAKLVPDMVVNPGLDDRIRTKLLDGNRLNISPFSFQALSRVLTRLDERRNTPEAKREFLMKVWDSYNRHEIQADTNTLNKLPIAVAKTNNASGYQFLTIEDFKTQKYPAMLEVDMVGSLGSDARAVFEVLMKHGLLVIERKTFPAWSLDNPWVVDEDIKRHGGQYRLLRCLQTIASKSHHSVESFVRTELGAAPDLLEKLGKVLRYVNWGQFPQAHKDSARSILRQMPIIPSSGHPKRYLTAQNALLAPSTRLKLDQVPRAQRFVSNDWADNNHGEIQFLSLEPITMDDFLINDFGVWKGSILPEDKLEMYVGILRDNTTYELRSRLPVALNGDRVFCMANTLYHHNHEVFRAAFHQSSSKSFLHPKLRHITWDKIINKIDDDDVFFACALGIYSQTTDPSHNQTARLVERATHVFDFLRWETPELRSICGRNQMRSWLSIPFVPAFVPTSPNIDNAVRISTMRGKVPPTQLTELSSGVLLEYADICWSQKSFFKQAPCNTVLSILPGRARPTPLTVISHLQFLSANRHKISSAEFPSFISSAKACYRYLLAFGRDLQVPMDEEIWFNTDDENPSREAFNNSWVSTKNLCLGLEYDSLPLQCVRKSLQTFVDLLKACNVRTIRGPKAVPPPQRQNGDTPYASVLLSQFQRFRAEQKFIDVHICIDGASFGVHKTVLCAASEYFRVMFANHMREETEGQIDWDEAGFEVQTAERVIDWIYTGEMTAIPESDPTTEMEQLLELVGAAHRYMLHDLKGCAANRLISQRYIRPETVSRLLEYAEQWDAGELKAQCEQYVSDNRDIIQREGF